MEGRHRRCRERHDAFVSDAVDGEIDAARVVPRISMRFRGFASRRPARARSAERSSRRRPLPSRTRAKVCTWPSGLCETAARVPQCLLRRVRRPSRARPRVRAQPHRHECHVRKYCDEARDGRVWRCRLDRGLWKAGGGRRRRQDPPMLERGAFDGLDAAYLMHSTSAMMRAGDFRERAALPACDEQGDGVRGPGSAAQPGASRGGTQGAGGKAGWGVGAWAVRA